MMARASPADTQKGPAATKYSLSRHLPRTSILKLPARLTPHAQKGARHAERRLWQRANTSGSAGALAPIVLVAAVILAAAGRPEYQHATQTISELGEVGARRAALMNYGGFLPYGLLVIALAFGLHAVVRRGSGDWLGPVLLGIYGLAYVAVAFAPCDPGCTGTSLSPHEKAHVLIGRVVIMTSLAAPLVLYPRLAKDPAWSSLGWLLIALPVVGYLVFLGVIPSLPFGWQQRLWIGCTLLWVMVLGLRLIRDRSET